MMTANAADEDWNLLLPFFSPDWRELAKVTEALKEQYRFRWQIELVFKRFKQIAQLGHLPEYDEDSAHARLYGKLFVTLLTEKLIRHADAISPGDSRRHTKRPPSRWREFSFAFHQFAKAIEPSLALDDMPANWGRSQNLAEAPRRRKLQEQAFSETS